VGQGPLLGAARAQKHIQVDIDEDMLGLNKPVDVAVLGDITLFLEALLAKLNTLGAPPNLTERQANVARYGEMRAKERAKLDELLTDPKAPLTAAHVTNVCQGAFPQDAFVVLDGGNTAVWGNFYHEVRTPRALLWTPKFGMLGAGVAQALGAQVAHPGRAVYCIIGDGAMGFNQQEIETAVRNRLPVIYLVCVDRQWGMVKMNQQFALKPLKTLVFKALKPHETINADFCEIQYDQLAIAMGAHGERVVSSSSDPRSSCTSRRSSIHPRARRRRSAWDVDVRGTEHVLEACLSPSAPTSSS
jgi:acetolactate synthase-1/2/3 large subunit